MDSVASDWFWFWLPLLVVVVVVRALAVPSSLLVSWSWLTSLSHHTTKIKKANFLKFYTKTREIGLREKNIQSK